MNYYAIYGILYMLCIYAYTHTICTDILYVYCLMQHLI